MKAVQAIKKMVALGMGLTMVGATIFAASAYTLADWPAPFVVNGTPASNLAIVVGDNAAGEDVLGGIDVIQALQQQAVVTVAAAGVPSQLVVEGDAVEIGSTSDLLEINENLGDVRETLTEVDLDMLKGGQIVTNKGSTEFNQYIRFPDNQGNVTFAKDERDRVGHYLFYNDGDLIFQWQLEFEEGLRSRYDDDTRDLRDLEDEDITILGQPFVVVDTDVVNNSGFTVSGGSPDVTIEFIGGAVSAVLGENDKETYVVDGKEYEVEVLVISETAASGEGSVKFRINGEITDELQDGETDVLADGTQIGIRDILATGKDIQKSIVQFYIGAYKVEFRDTNTSDSIFLDAGARVNEETIERSSVSISGEFATDGREFTINNIFYNLTADAVLGDMYIPPGGGVREQLDEPEGMLTPAWDIRYEGLMDTGVTLVRVDSSGDDEYDLEFTNQEGIFYDVPFASNEAGAPGFKYGDDDDDLWFTELNQSIGDDDFFIVSNCQVDLSPVVHIGNAPGSGLADNTCFTHIFRYDSIDTTNNVVRLTDLGTGTREFPFDSTARTGNIVAGGVTYIFNVSNLGAGNQLTVDLDGNGVFEGTVQNASDINHSNEVVIAIQGEGLIDLGSQNDSGFSLPIAPPAVAPSNITASLITLSKEFDEAATNEIINITIEPRSSNEIGIQQVAQFTGAFFSGLLDLEENEDLEQALSGYGVFFELFDPSGASEAEDLTVEYPLSQRGARVFVTGGVVTTSEVSAGGAQRVNNIQLGAAMLASEVGANYMDYNAVVVGGPCANPVAAALLNNPEPCYESVGENRAMVELFEHANGNVALLVNGRTALNTRQGARAVATGAIKNVQGMQAEITGTTLTDITVRAV